MGENSGIQWTMHTLNAWEGCEKVSPGCTNCYAEARDQRFHGGKHWGPSGVRRRTSAANWKKPIAWNKRAALLGVRERVFVNSLADVFEDRAELVEWRLDLWRLIAATPNLDWLLLTKRPENLARFLPWCVELPGFIFGGVAWPNVWLGTTVEDQQRANERIPELLKVPAVVRFLSCEPLLGPLDLSPWLDEDKNGFVHTIDWVIIGGESGPGARPFALEWARSLVAQCRDAGRGDTFPFVKQLGAVPTVGFYDDEAREWFEREGFEWPDPIGWDERDGQPRLDARVNVRGKDRSGGDPAEWPADLRVREFPVVPL